MAKFQATTRAALEVPEAPPCKVFLHGVGEGVDVCVRDSEGRTFTLARLTAHGLRLFGGIKSVDFPTDDRGCVKLDR